ncbi:CsbD family protein [Caldimonas tepidiphila]|uniref:CsbD family protein n=1 Tax=Caldimonas tepidiphila TaxID=2315841 RepID=UPI000E5BBAFB|nr:CsbD family protein [Caldimonas tepidiphila]
MNKDQMKGRLDQAKGKAKEVTGKATGDREMRGEGKADQMSGKMQGKVGDAKESVKRKIDKL